MPISSNPDARARQIAALTPFTSETAPKGRKNAGLSVNEWRNELAQCSRAEIKAVLADEDAPAAKVLAAVELLEGMTGNLNAIAQICEFTDGKATQRSENVTTHRYIRTVRLPDGRN